MLSRLVTGSISILMYVPPPSPLHSLPGLANTVFSPLYNIKPDRDVIKTRQLALVQGSIGGVMNPHKLGLGIKLLINASYKVNLNSCLGLPVKLVSNYLLINPAMLFWFDKTKPSENADMPEID